MTEPFSSEIAVCKIAAWSKSGFVFEGSFFIFLTKLKTPSKNYILSAEFLLNEKMLLTEDYLEPCQTSKLEHFATIADGL